jgi:hypothetical protein
VVTCNRASTFFPPRHLPHFHKSFYFVELHVTLLCSAAIDVCFVSFKTSALSIFFICVSCVGSGRFGQFCFVI